MNDQVSDEIKQHTKVMTTKLETKREELSKSVRQCARKIDSKVVTIEKVWRELVEFFDCYTYYKPNIAQVSLKKDTIVSAFTKCMQSSCAMELLDGDHLVVHPEFLGEVFSRFAKTGGETGCRTVSILGPQSSGKSTIANALWGGDFATSAGRCTKGLYASIFRTNFDGLPWLLFLDTEGLCSVENEPEFDQKLALLTIAMSDVILINVRGDIDIKVSNVLQIAVFCLREMSILEGQRRPELVFVQRDMVDFSQSKSATTMNILEKSMRDATKLLKNPDGRQVELKDILHFNRDSLFLMPSAYQPVDKTLYSHSGELQMPNPSFGEGCFKLRQKIVELAVGGVCNVGGIQKWGQRFCTVKTTIDKFKDLTNFTSVFALQTQQALDEQLQKLLDIYIYGHGEKQIDGECMATEMSQKQAECEEAVATAHKKVGATQRYEELERIKRDFVSFTESAA